MCKHQKHEKNVKNGVFRTPTLPQVGTCTRGFWAQFTKGKMAFFGPFSALFLSSGPPEKALKNAVFSPF